MKVIINLPSDNDNESRKLLQDSIDIFITSLIVETINQIPADNKTKKAIATETLELVNEKAMEL